MGRDQHETSDLQHDAEHPGKSIPNHRARLAVIFLERGATAVVRRKSDLAPVNLCFGRRGKKLGWNQTPSALNFTVDRPPEKETEDNVQQST